MLFSIQPEPVTVTLYPEFIFIIVDLIKVLPFVLIVKFLEILTAELSGELLVKLFIKVIVAPEFVRV